MQYFKTCQKFSFGKWCLIFNSSLSYHLENHMLQRGQECCWQMSIWNFKSSCAKDEILIFNPTFQKRGVDCSFPISLSFINTVVEGGLYLCLIATVRCISSSNSHPLQYFQSTLICMLVTECFLKQVFPVIPAAFNLFSFSFVILHILIYPYCYISHVIYN